MQHRNRFEDPRLKPQLLPDAKDFAWMIAGGLATLAVWEICAMIVDALL